MGCTYRSNSTRSGDEVSGHWANSGFSSSSIVCFSHSWIKFQMLESLSLAASEADAVLERAHQKKSHMNNSLTGLIRPLSWSFQRTGLFLPSQLSPLPFALWANEKFLVYMSYIEGKGNTSTDWKRDQQGACSVHAPYRIKGARWNLFIFSSWCKASAWKFSNNNKEVQRCWDGSKYEVLSPFLDGYKSSPVIAEVPLDIFLPDFPHAGWVSILQAEGLCCQQKGYCHISATSGFPLTLSPNQTE